jgi:hypothetical protein
MCSGVAQKLGVCSVTVTECVEKVELVMSDEFNMFTSDPSPLRASGWSTSVPANTCCQKHFLERLALQITT